LSTTADGWFYGGLAEFRGRAAGAGNCCGAPATGFGTKLVIANKGGGRGARGGATDPAGPTGGGPQRPRTGLLARPRRLGWDPDAHRPTVDLWQRLHNTLGPSGYLPVGEDAGPRMGDLSGVQQAGPGPATICGISKTDNGWQDKRRAARLGREGAPGARWGPPLVVGPRWEYRMAGPRWVGSATVDRAAERRGGLGLGLFPWVRPSGAAGRSMFPGS